MASHRIERVNELIRQQCNDVMLREIEFPNKYLVTVKKVDTKADLKNSIIWLSVLPVQHSGEALHLVENNSYKIQSILFKKLNLKFVPKICFKIDTSEEKADRIYRLLDKQKGLR